MLLRGARPRALPGAVLLDGRARAVRRWRPRTGRAVAAGEARWSAEVDGLVPDLALVDRVADGRRRRRRRGRDAAKTMDSTRRLGPARDGCGRRRRSTALALRTALALEAVGIAQRALELGRRAREGPRSSSASRSASTRPSRTRSSTRSWRPSSPARSPTGRRGASPKATSEAAIAAAAAKAYRRRGGGLRVRALDPGARRDRLHVGAPAAPLLQARAVDPGLRRLPGRAAGGDRAALLG